MSNQMIEVIVYHDRDMLVRDAAEAADPEGALLAARTLWDEADHGILGQRRTVDFLVDGRIIRRMEMRP